MRVLGKGRIWSTNSCFCHRCRYLCLAYSAPGCVYFFNFNVFVFVAVRISSSLFLVISLYYHRYFISFSLLHTLPCGLVHHFGLLLLFGVNIHTCMLHYRCVFVKLLNLCYNQVEYASLVLS